MFNGYKCQRGNLKPKTAYWLQIVDRDGQEHKILVFEVGNITASLGYVDVSELVNLFTGLSSNDVYRPIGPVDVLIGIYEASLFPTVIEGMVVSNLRVLQSKFGTGKLLDGSHELVNTEPIFMDKKLFALSHAIPGKGTLKVSNFVRKNVNNFLDGEELAVSQPRRCDNCVNCKNCSVKQQEMCRKDKRELEMIKSNLKLNLNERKFTFVYPYIKDPSALTDNIR